MAKVIQAVVTGAYATLYSATLHLSADQADARRRRLEAVKVRKDGSGVYLISRPPVQFKHGERFGIEAPIPKDQMQVLSDADELERQAAEEQERRAAEEAETAARVAQDARESAAAAELAAQRHAALVTAFQGVQADEQGNVDLSVLERAVPAAKLADPPSFEEMERAWEAVVASRVSGTQ